MTTRGLPASQPGCPSPHPHTSLLGVCCTRRPALLAVCLSVACPRPRGPSLVSVSSAMGNPSLLLLPPPPQPADHAALNAAYRPPLHGAISALKGDKDGAILVVALAAPLLAGTHARQRSLSWPGAQSLIAGLYSVISIVCAQLSLRTDLHAGPGSVDVRVVLVHHDASHQPADPKTAIDTNNTTVVQLPTFVAAYHPWRDVFHVNTEAGYSLLKAYLSLSEHIQVFKQDQLVVVEGGLALNVASPQPPESTPQTKPHSIVCLGGTFDHLHPGHKLLLHAAVLLLDVPEAGSPSPCRFVIGITGDELLKKKKYAEHVQPWDERATNVIEFLASILHLSKDGWRHGYEVKIVKKEGELIALFRDDTIEVQCVVIQDAFGPTITAQEMDALVVSGETRSGGDAVNSKRQEKGWHPLEIFEVDVLDAEEIGETPTKTDNFETKISSTAIRKQKAELAMKSKV
jgi:phosphopantetheine adenylyltransferase